MTETDSNERLKAVIAKIVSSFDTRGDSARGELNVIYTPSKFGTCKGARAVALCAFARADGYPFHDGTFTVTHCGRVCFHGRKINLSHVFAGQNVGVTQVGERI